MINNKQMSEYSQIGFIWRYENRTENRLFKVKISQHLVVGLFSQRPGR